MHITTHGAVLHAHWLYCTVRRIQGKLLAPRFFGLDARMESNLKVCPNSQMAFRFASCEYGDLRIFETQSLAADEGLRRLEGGRATAEEQQQQRERGSLKDIHKKFRVRRLKRRHSSALIRKIYYGS